MALMAHRGITTFARDNSRSALRSVASVAKEKTPLGIEVDIRSTLDGLVLSHDPVQKGVVLGQSTGADLFKIFGEYAPIGLSDALHMLGPVPFINLEIKEAGITHEVVALAKRHLARFGKPDDAIVISSFLPHVVAESKVMEPSLPTGLLIEEGMDALTVAADQVLARVRTAEPRTVGVNERMLGLLDVVGADFLNPHWSDLDADLLDAVRERDKRLMCWTVNDEKLLTELSLRPEVAHVITDFPELIFPAVRTRRVKTASSD